MLNVKLPTLGLEEVGFQQEAYIHMHGLTVGQRLCWVLEVTSHLRIFIFF